MRQQIEERSAAGTKEQDDQAMLFLQQFARAPTMSSYKAKRTRKRAMDQGYFLTRRLCNVRAEMSLTILAYKIKRALKLKGTQELMAALQA